MTRNSFIRHLAFILVLAMMIPMAAFGEGGDDAWVMEAEAFVDSVIETSDEEEADVVSESVEVEPKEVEMELQANDEDGPVSKHHDVDIIFTDKKVSSLTVTMNQGDTLRISVSNATGAVSCTPSQKNYVTIGSTQKEAEGKYYVDITADQPIKKLKLKVAVQGNKKQKATVNLVIKDPYIPQGIVISERMPQWVALGWKFNVNGLAAFDTSYAKGTMEWKASGAAKIDKEGWFIPSKVGTAKITVKAKNNKKATESCTVEVRANQVKWADVPKADDFSKLDNGWTLWPVSVVVNKKGGLDCQFYLLNGTPEKTKEIAKLELTLAAGSSSNIIARYTTSKKGKPFKVSVDHGKAKIIKVTMDIEGDMNGVLLSDSKLFFGINSDAMMTSAKKGTGPYSFQRTKFPVVSSATGISISQTQAVMTLGGEPLTLTATLEPAGADGTVVWSSSDTNVATVENGVVTAVAAGSAVITAACAENDSIKATCAITVNPVPGPDVVLVESITLQETATLTVGGEPLTLSWTVSPDNATNSVLRWESDNTNVVTVKDGVITPVSAGEASITATTTDGSEKTATCKVTVESVPTSDFIAENGVIIGYTGAGGDIVIPDVDGAGNLITAIGEGAFRNCATITRVEVSSKVTEIRAFAFEGCAALGSVTMPDGVKTIGEGAFMNCSSITRMKVPAGVTKIQASTFENCGGLESVTLPNGVETIGKAAFKGCVKLSSMDTE